MIKFATSQKAGDQLDIGPREVAPQSMLRANRRWSDNTPLGLATVQSGTTCLGDERAMDILLAVVLFDVGSETFELRSLEIWTDDTGVMALLLVVGTSLDALGWGGGMLEFKEPEPALVAEVLEMRFPSIAAISTPEVLEKRFPFGTSAN